MNCIECECSSAYHLRLCLHHLQDSLCLELSSRLGLGLQQFQELFGQQLASTALRAAYSRRQDTHVYDTCLWVCGRLLESLSVESDREESQLQCLTHQTHSQVFSLSIS